MPGIRITGMASGLPPNIVDQLMDAERIPVKQMEVKKSNEEEKYKLIEDFETKINEIPKSIGELVGIKGFTNMKLNSGDPNIINGVADPNEAITGSWTVEVEQLATKPGAVSCGFPDPDKSQLGVGYLKFSTADGDKEVYINGKNNTLKGVAAAINNASVGMRATVVNDRKDKENPYRLLVTGLASGDDKQVSFPTVYMLDGDQDLTFEEQRPAQNAKVKVDGFEIEVGDNQLKDAIPGVTLDLKQAALGRPISISVKEDSEMISGKIKAFVDAYNGVLNFIQGQQKLQKSKDGREHLGPMGGDGMLRTVENDFRRLIMNPQMGTQGSIKQMNQLGVEFNRNGSLTLTQDKFNKALATDPASVASFLHGDGLATGFIPSVQREVTNLMNGAFGPVSMRKHSLTDKIKQLDERIDNKNRQLEKKEDQLRTKFADLEAQMSKLNQQGSAVAGIGGGKS
jgi:flagellar hook-associated protein 2